MARRARRFAAAVGLAMVALPVASAWAEWTSGASGAGVARSQQMPAGPTPQVSVVGRNVTVSWPSATLPGGDPVAAYRVRRVAANGTAATVGTACNTTQTGLTCTETAVAPGSWSYGLTALLGSWTGAEGTRTAATVGAPTFTLSSPAVTTLPGTVTGTIANYVGPATLAFRLDNATTGTLLSATPAGVPAAGGAQVSLTIPAGVTQGSHTIFAIGGGGDSVAATILVDTVAPSPTALATANGTGTLGASDAGDSVSVTFSERLSASSLCAAWTDDTTVKTLSGGVVVTITHDGNPSSSDILTVAAPACGPAGFRFGTVNLGNKGFVRGGSSATYGASGTSASISWNPSTRTLTIVLGTASGNNFGTVPSSTAVYTPDPVIKDIAGLGITGTASSTGRQL
jgi:hypothetical protein